MLYTRELVRIQLNLYLNARATVLQNHPTKHTIGVNCCRYLYTRGAGTGGAGGAQAPPGMAVSKGV